MLEIKCPFGALSASIMPCRFYSSPPFHLISQRHLHFDSGSLHDVCFVVEQERVYAHQCLLSARFEYFRSMFGAGFKDEGDR